jgi:hypothetical protein
VAKSLDAWQLNWHLTILIILEHCKETAETMNTSLFVNCFILILYRDFKWGPMKLSNHQFKLNLTWLLHHITWISIIGHKIDQKLQFRHLKFKSFHSNLFNLSVFGLFFTTNDFHWDRVLFMISRLDERKKRHLH